MKLLIALLLGILVFGLMNNSSLLSIGLILLGVYLLFNIVQGAKSNASTLKKFVDVKEINFDNLKCPEGIVDNMLKDAGKVTKNMLNGNKTENIGKALHNGTYNALQDVGAPFKN
ncbi:MAG: hypothetical protein PHH82_02450 [Candidatus ainarchaeum sp.]|nr:hypothetical protein [Candidatus ainarchaeum sp.]